MPTANNARIEMRNGQLEVLSIDGHEMITCQHCRNFRRADSFKDNDEIDAWYRDCVNNPLGSHHA
jgi:hypothetical protein